MALKRKRLAQRRRALGYTQEQLAETLRVDRTTIVRWERAVGEPQPSLRRRLAEVLEISLDTLDDFLADISMVAALDKHIDARVTVGTTTSDGGDTTNRRHFTITTGLAALGLTEPLRGLATPAEPPRILGTEHVHALTDLITRLEHTDASAGGGALYDIVTALHGRVATWARVCTYSTEVGAGLQSVLGTLAAWIGWLAVDAERRNDARRHLHDAIVHARIADDPVLETQALTSLSLLVRRNQPRTSIQYAQAAQRTSTGWATPRVRSLLHLRVARACAEQNDLHGFQRAMAKARTEFDDGVHADDPLFVHFVTPLEVAGIEGLSYLAMNRPDRAAGLFQTIIDNPDPTYRRNHVYYAVDLAEATRRQGDVSAAAQIARRLVPAVAALRSARITRGFADLRTNLGPYVDRVPAARDFTDAYDSVFAA